VEGGWYHITTRGMFRKEIFENGGKGNMQCFERQAEELQKEEKT
jgi:hypothetical protein